MNPHFREECECIAIEIMRFLSKSECEELASPVGLDFARIRPTARIERMKHGTRFLYGGGSEYVPSPQAPAFAHQLVNYFGQFSWILLWAYDCPFWYSSKDKQPPVWQHYIRWRNERGEMRPRHETPGHLFEADEAQELTVALEHMINTRCDAVLFGRPLRYVITFSDGDLLLVQSRHNMTRLSAAFARLGIKEIGF